MSTKSLWRLHGAMALFWLVVLGVMYLAMDYWLKPAVLQVQADGSVVLQRHRDGHFYAQGSINGESVLFMVDTGASTISVTDTFAERAGLQGGQRVTFSTANGDRQGRIVRANDVVLGPLRVRNVMVGTGYTAEDDAALLGQNFLRHFDVIMREDSMRILPRL